MKAFRPLATLGLLLSATVLSAAAPATLPRSSTGSAELDAYFRSETEHIAAHSLADIKSLADWQARREGYRQQLLEMLGLSPLPERTDLKPVITGKIEHELFNVEKLQFQSSPGLYVTGDLYLPKKVDKPLPTILYVCGHGQVKSNGVSYGNKVHYQHHGEWFARNGYVCLIIDTIQLGELEGIHHGTYREGMWWWNARGYTPAGVEAWNCMRALDYLETRPEVDKTRFGVTGRSGGGAYSWWIAATDERIKVAVPVAGITDLQNYVVDGAVEGHCDCMFMVNTYRWNYAQVAALIAPRPLLLSNSDKDNIFPLDGVMRVHDAVAKIYDLYGKGTNFGVLITEGPHSDTQDLQVPAFRWFNRFLKGEQPLIEMAAKEFLTPQDLKVFKELPADQRTTKIHDTFVPLARPAVPADAAAWSRQRDEWLADLKDKCFAGWPTDSEAGPLNVKRVFSQQHEGVQFEAYDFQSQPHVTLRVYVAYSAGKRPQALLYTAMDDATWRDAMAKLRTSFPAELADEGKIVTDTQPEGFNELKGMLDNFDGAIAGISPRGTGLDAWRVDSKKLVQIRRRFQLVGQTLDGMRVWDIRRGLSALQSTDTYRGLPFYLLGKGDMGVNVLYASLFTPDVQRLELEHLPTSHQQGPDYLNVLRFLDIPQAVALATERGTVGMKQEDSAPWDYAIKTAVRLGWNEHKFHIQTGE